MSSLLMSYNDYCVMNFFTCVCLVGAYLLNFLDIGLFIWILCLSLQCETDFSFYDIRSGIYAESDSVKGKRQDPESCTLGFCCNNAASPLAAVSQQNS